MARAAVAAMRLTVESNWRWGAMAPSLGLARMVSVPGRRGGFRNQGQQAVIAVLELAQPVLL